MNGAPSGKGFVGVPLQQVHPKHLLLRQHALRREVRHGLFVELHGPDVEVAAIQQRSGQCACAGPDFQDVRAAAVLRDALGNASGGVQVTQEMLTEVFFGANVHGSQGRQSP